MTMANELREQALQKFIDAKALIDPETDELSPEKEPEFKVVMDEAMALDKRYEAAAARENGSVDRLDERLAYYTGKATGEPMRFNRTELDPTRNMSLGQQFVASDAYKELAESHKE